MHFKAPIYLNFQRSWSGCRDLAVVTLRYASGDGDKLETIDEKIQKECLADSWKFYNAFFPSMVEGLERCELISKKPTEGSPFLCTTHKGKQIIRRPRDFWSVYREEFEYEYHSLQVADLKARRDQ